MVYPFELVIWDSSGIVPPVESLGEKAVPFLVFLEIPYCLL